MDMLPGNIHQGHTHLGGVEAIPGCWICCLATYLRGTLNLGGVGGHSWLLDTLPGFWICCLATYLRGTLIGRVWGAFLAAGYAAWRHTSGAHSLGWYGGHSWLLDMLPGNIPQGQTHLGGVGDIPACWICCLATYLRGTLNLGGVGDIAGCWI